MSGPSDLPAQAPLPGASRSWWPHVLLLAVAVVAAVVFLSKPDIDLIIARSLYYGDRAFYSGESGWVQWVRNAFVAFYFGCIGLALVGMVRTWKDDATWLRWKLPQWLFLAICLGAGPGLVANVILKDNWGRARPKHVAEFGGSKVFTPPLLLSRECRRNCSFVSGEASSMYVPFYAAAVLMPQNAAVLVIGGTIAGLSAGLVRMAQGGHFLSDVIFAGVFMALTVLIVRRLMFGAPVLPALRRRLQDWTARAAKSLRAGNRA